MKYAACSCLLAAASAVPPAGAAVAEWRQADAGLPPEPGVVASLLENMHLVRNLNRNGDGAIYSTDGPWAHLSPAHFQDRVLMRPRAAPDVALQAAREPGAADLAAGPLPEAFDWSSSGRSVVTAVRDQGALGSCWALSATENVEGQAALALGRLARLSAEQLVECDNSIDIKCGGRSAKHGTAGCADCGMFGGWPYLAYQFLQHAGGIFTEEEWPYQHAGLYPCMPEGYSKKACGDHDDLFCRKNSTKGQGLDRLCDARSGFAVRVTGWKAMSLNETELAAQLVRYGPLSVLLEASNLQFYHSGIWRGGILGCKPDPEMGVLGLDHAVLLVGYGMDGQTPYWKVKNSWGTKWGEQGYFRILRGQGTCGINLAATTAEVAGAEDVPADSFAV